MGSSNSTTNNVVVITKDADQSVEEAILEAAASGECPGLNPSNVNYVSQFKTTTTVSSAISPEKANSLTQTRNYPEKSAKDNPPSYGEIYQTLNCNVTTKLDDARITEDFKPIMSTAPPPLFNTPPPLLTAPWQAEGATLSPGKPTAPSLNMHQYINKRSTSFIEENANQKNSQEATIYKHNIQPYQPNWHNRQPNGYRQQYAQPFQNRQPNMQMHSNRNEFKYPVPYGHVPCPNHQRGCRYTTPHNQTNDHPFECPLRVIQCPRHGECFWNGSLLELLQHFSISHRSKETILFNQPIKLNLDIRKPHSDIQLLCVNNMHYFIYNFQIDPASGYVLWAVRRYGSKSCATKFKYELKIFDESNPKRSYSTIQDCQSDTSPFQSVAKSGSCAVVAMSVLRTYLDHKQNLSIKLTIAEKKIKS